MPTRALLRALAFALPIASIAVASAPRIALAQVSDADRAAARELYIEGVKLQEQGKFEPALDKFQRAQSVFSAPTHLLHIAECQAALGRLVESAETYRTLVRTPLPSGSPNAFVQAQQQGSAELPQVEPRIPTLKIQVKPENAQNLSVQIDGQPMSAALVGVPRPANPGEHHVVVFAPGYAKSEAKVVLKEREQKELPITLQASTTGVVYGPPIQQLPPPSNAPPGSTYSGQQAQVGGVVGGVQGQPPAEQPPPYEAQQQTYMEKHRGAPVSFLIGPHAGLAIPSGSFSGNTGDTVQGDTKVSDVHGAGGAFGVDAGIRFVRVLYLGVSFDHGIYSRGSAIDNQAATIPPDVSLTSTNSSNYFGLTFAWISNPEGVGFWGELGLGYRWLNSTARLENTGNSSIYSEISQTWRGGEASIGAGLHIRVSPGFRMVPKVTVGGGSFSKFDVSCTSSNPTLCPAILNRDSVDVGTTDTHTFIFVGAIGFFDIGKHD
jgi:hypothetical protein